MIRRFYEKNICSSRSHASRPVIIRTLIQIVRTLIHLIKGLAGFPLRRIYGNFLAYKQDQNQDNPRIL
ncbi:Uncharacterized protein dnm_096710 [Desulfonema magnum]|uniref:Uncharacterized protein n=1 Tax=Desulfonema magnum TaxID=45655 RepID=A0A975GVN5_9BACT|nr:Uncharacterized protein dnm_096710 [Desulfonema magnum]